MLLISHINLLTHKVLPSNTTRIKGRAKTMPVKFTVLCALIFSCLSLKSNAVWFEASGQAAIENGNKALARQVATQEAIKQALLFAGASVKSVQEMTNGLLQQDRLEVRSYGEVNKLQLINETYHNGYVSISIRADIFAQDAQCDASDYQKSIATTLYPIRNRQQAAVGGIFELGEVLPSKLKSQFKQSQHARIKNIEPIYPQNSNQNMGYLITELARKSNSQFVLMAQVTELSVAQAPSNGLAFWRDSMPVRHFGFDVSLYNGQTGELIFSEEYIANAKWQFDMHSHVDPHSEILWQSDYGKSIDAILEQVSQEIDEKISCLPAYGRVLNVANEQLKINLGASQGVQKGDQLTLFQLNQFQDPDSRDYLQYQLHPVKVTVRQVFSQTAIASASDGSFLANIQPNDFVARQ